VDARSVARSMLRAFVRPARSGSLGAAGLGSEELAATRRWLEATLFDIDPRLIRWRLRPWLHGYASQAIPRSVVVAGPWDRLLVAYHPHPVVRQRREAAANPGVVEDDGPGPSAPVMDRVRRRRYRTPEDVARRSGSIDRLLRGLATEGFQSRSEGPERSEDEIGLYVTRRGDLVWGRQGDHRLSAAQLHGSPSVPVIVRGVHAGFWRSAVQSQEAVVPALRRALRDVGLHERPTG
jgi:hypothetical protein